MLKGSGIEMSRVLNQLQNTHQACKPDENKQNVRFHRGNTDKLTGQIYGKPRKRAHTCVQACGTATTEGFTNRLATKQMTPASTVSSVCEAQMKVASTMPSACFQP